MSGISEAINYVVDSGRVKCARDGCDVYEQEPHPITRKMVQCLKIAQAVPGRGVILWCSEECAREPVSL